MKKEEFYNLIIGKTIVITGGADGLGFSYTGLVNNIKDDTLMIDNLIVVLDIDDVDIDSNENNIHIKINKKNSLWVTILDNIKQ